MIWHILRKDLRRLWPAIGVACMLLACLARLDSWRFDYEVGLPETVLNVLVPLVWAVLIALSVHLDPLTSNKAFWLSRPVRRSSLLAAKLLFAFVAIHVPMFIADAWILMTHGFAPVHASLFTKQLLVLCSVTLPSLALAAVTSSVAAFGFCAVSGCVVALFSNNVLVGPNYPWLRIDWSPGALALTVVSLGAVVMIAVQYARRSVVLARVSGGTVAAAALLTFVYIPRDLTAAIECGLERGLIGRLDVRYDVEGNAQAHAWQAPGRVAIALPVRLTGLQQSEKVLAEQLFLRMSGGGRVWEERRGAASTLWAHFDVDPHRATQVQILMPERNLIQGIGTNPVVVEGRATVRPLRPGAARTLPPAFEQTDLAGLGRCLSIVQWSRYGYESVKVMCEAAGHLSPYVGVTLRDEASGREWKRFLGDSRNVRNFPAFSWLSPLQRRQTFFEIRDGDPGAAGDYSTVPTGVLEHARISIAPTFVEGCANVSYSFTVPDLQRRIVQPQR